ncbi:MAG TPA: hypothetical protein VMU95_15415 [Trebonia sp.]|nr:hypothetical protein [Trebonia sp.]
MAIVALVTWTLTVAVGVYLLITSTRPGARRPGGAVTAEAPVVVTSVTAASAAPVGARTASSAAEAAGDDEPARLRAGRPADPKTINRNKFDPPSLARAKAESIPGGRALAEFLHPMLGITGFGLFLGYVMSRAWILGAIALGIGVGAVAAGLTWAFVNARTARRHPDDPHAMAFSPRVLAIHATGAAVTILLAALIVARV